MIAMADQEPEEKPNERISNYILPRETVLQKEIMGLSKTLMIFMDGCSDILQEIQDNGLMGKSHPSAIYVKVNKPNLVSLNGACRREEMMLKSIVVPAEVFMGIVTCHREIKEKSSELQPLLKKIMDAMNPDGGDGDGDSDNTN